MTRQRRIYFDHNASTPLAEKARAAIVRFLADDHGGNPSSIHFEGRAARDQLERARAQMAGLVGGQSAEIIWTASGTEAVCLGLMGCARARLKAGASPRVLVGASEHPSVLAAATLLGRQGFAIARLPVNGDGIIDLERARPRILGGAAVIGLSLANHEVGTIQPIATIAELAHEVGAAMFCDAVGAAGKLSIDLNALGVDALAVSAHKFYGPRGVGALWLREGEVIEAALIPGHQERERRGGTENILGAVSAGAAAAVATTRTDVDSEHNAALSKRLELGLRELGAMVIGCEAPRVSNTTCFRFEGIGAETLVAALDLRNFALSAGAACTSGKTEPSSVLLAMGLDAAIAKEAVRCSFGRGNDLAQVEQLLEELPAITSRIRRFH